MNETGCTLDFMLKLRSIKRPYTYSGPTTRKPFCQNNTDENISRIKGSLGEGVEVHN